MQALWLGVTAVVSTPRKGRMLQRLRIRLQLRKLEKGRSFPMKNSTDSRILELLPLVEAEIVRLRASQIKLRYPHIFRKEE
jgi:hypothetical protein